MTTSSSASAMGLRPAGPGHPRVRQYLHVRHNRAPRPPGAVALEGQWAVRTALDAGIDIEVVFVCPPLLRGDAGPRLVEDLRAAGTPHLHQVSERLLARMVARDGPDGLAALAHLRSARLSDLAVGPDTRVLIADGVDLAGNLGTLIRCADGAGATAVVVTERRVRLTHPLVVKASMGTLFSLPVVDAEAEEAVAWCRHRGVRIVGADPAAPASYRVARWCPPVAVVVGNERHGLSPFWKATADELVSIPMHGRADSLNVGHAAALLLYEAAHAAAGPSAGAGGGGGGGGAR